MADKIQVTKEGLKKLQDEYDRRVHVTREEIKQQLAEARAMGDLSENADYDAAREAQTENESRIMELEEMLKPSSYEIINTRKGGKKNVHVGSTVTVKFLDTNTKETYTILGTTESDPLNGKISNESPLAAAILNAKVGDTCEVNVKVPYNVEVLDIK